MFQHGRTSQNRIIVLNSSTLTVHTTSVHTRIRRTTLERLSVVLLIIIYVQYFEEHSPPFLVGCATASSMTDSHETRHIVESHENETYSIQHGRFPSHRCHVPTSHRCHLAKHGPKGRQGRGLRLDRGIPGRPSLGGVGGGRASARQARSRARIFRKTA
jgi:hypothetical protein